MSNQLPTHDGNEDESESEDEHECEGGAMTNAQRQKKFYDIHKEDILRHKFIKRLESGRLVRAENIDRFGITYKDIKSKDKIHPDVKTYLLTKQNNLKFQKYIENKK